MRKRYWIGKNPVKKKKKNIEETWRYQYSKVLPLKSTGQKKYRRALKQMEKRVLYDKDTDGTARDSR